MSVDRFENITDSLSYLTSTEEDLISYSFDFKMESLHLKKYEIVNETERDQDSRK